jgi:hypothetical protein
VTGALRTAVLGVWTGLLAAWALVFVPALFGHLPSTGAVAVLVGVTLARIDAAGIALGLLAVGLGVASRPSAPEARAIAWVPLVGVLCHAASLFWLAPEIRAIREAAGGSVGQLPPDDPRLVAFRMLHNLSFGSFGLAGAAAIAALAGDLLALRRAMSRSPTEAEIP